MNRRAFLSLFAGAAAASTVKHFLPPIGGWHSDVIAQPNWALFNIDGGIYPWKSLYGIPYFYPTSNSGAYLGISRIGNKLSNIEA